MKEIITKIKTPKFTLRDIIEGNVIIQKPAFSLDVENTSLAVNGCLLEIGLVFFDLADPTTVGQFPMWDFFPDITNQLLNGGEVDPETMAFWNMERIASALDWQKKNNPDRQDIFAVVDQLENQVREFVKGLEQVGFTEKDIYWIARGEKDYPQLEHWFKTCHRKPICKFNRVQDVRSMIAAYLDKPQGYTETKKYPDFMADVIRHTAIGDALMDAVDLAQARYVHLHGERALDALISDIPPHRQ